MSHGCCGKKNPAPVADGTVKLSGREQVFRRSKSIRDHPARGEEHKDVLQGESDGSQPLDTMTDDSEARNDFWSNAGNYIYRHHGEPRVKLYVPKEESFPLPFEYIDLVSRTNTTLDVLLESRIDDYWNVDGDGPLSPSSRYHLKDICGTGKINESTIMSNISEQKGQQHWAKEKPKVDNARRLKGIY